MPQGKHLKGVQKKVISRNKVKKSKQAKVGAPAKKPKRSSIAETFNKNKKLSASIKNVMEGKLLGEVQKAGESTHMVKATAEPKGKTKLKFNPKKQFKL